MTPTPIIIAGPSGVGKSTIIKRIIERFPELQTFKTTTTRSRRTDTQDKYHFVSEEQFKKLIKDNQFLEWAKVHGNYYGAQKRHVQEVIDNNKHPVPANAVDIQGVRTYKKFFPGLISIFISYESLDELPNRIRNSRPNQSEKEIQTRLDSAKKEMSAIKEFDYVVINRAGRLNEAIDEVATIIKNKLSI